MRKIKIPSDILRKWANNPTNSQVTVFPVAVDWPELRLTEAQMMANAMAAYEHKPPPHPDNQVFLIELPNLFLDFWR